MSPARQPDDRPVWSRDLMGVYAVRRMLGRALRPDKKPITRHTLLRWRDHEGFPAPLKAPAAGCELWDRRVVKAWLESRRPRPPEEDVR